MIRISRKLSSRGYDRHIEMSAGSIIIETPGAEIIIEAGSGGPADKDDDHRTDFISIMRRGTPPIALDVIRQDVRRDCVRIIYRKQDMDALWEAKK